MIKGSINRLNTTITNIYAPNNRAPKIHEAKTDRIKRRNSSKIIVGDVNKPLSIMKRTTRQKINKKQ